MNANLDKIAKDLYGKIQTRFPEIKIGDENAEVLSKKTDIPKARFFEFEYKEEGEELGTIAITLDEEEGVVMQISGDLAERKHPGAFKFIRSFRQFAKDRLLNFDVQNIGKSNLDKRDYAFQAKPKEESMEPIMENKLFGTSRMSYQDLGEAKIIIKHSQPVNPDLPAGRTMHIEGIWVENAQGERFKYPVKHLNGARALAEHLKHGGIPYDGIGKHIVSLSEELAQLRKFKGYVSRNATLSEAMSDITDKVMERIDSVKKEIGLLQRPAYYEQFAESFTDREEQMIPEEVMSDWIDRLTIRTFNEDLKTAFPYIFRLVDETEIPVREVSPDDLLDEERTEEKDENGKVIRWKEEGEWKKADPKKDPRGKAPNLSDKARRETEKMTKEEAELLNFFDRIVSESGVDADGKNMLFSADASKASQALEKVKGFISSKLTAGPNGTNASLSLAGIIETPTFTNDYLKSLSAEDEVGPAIKLYINDIASGKITDPDLPMGSEKAAKQIIASNSLNINTGTPTGGDEVASTASADVAAEPIATANAQVPPTEPTATASTEVPPETPPMAETTGEKSPFSKIVRAIHRAKEAGATLETMLDFGHGVKSLEEIIGECGMKPQQFGFGASQANPIEEIWKTVEGFVDDQTGPTPKINGGKTRAKIKVLTAFKNGEFPGAKASHVKSVLEKLDEIDPDHEQHHAPEHARMQELAGVNGSQMAEASYADIQRILSIIGR
jgi:hypothetical protein